MKSIITTLFVLVLLSSIAFAQGQGIHEPGTGIEQPEVREEGQGTGQGLEQAAGEGEPVMVQTQAEEGAGEGEQIRERNMERLEVGLANALGNVKNENARARLQANIEKLQERLQNRLQNMEDVEVEEVDDETGAVTVRAKENVRFLGFIKGKATKRFEMDSKGNINERAPWYRFLYTEEDTEEE